MATDDLDRWLAGLRGQRHDDADATAGLRLRELVCHRRANDTEATTVDEQAWQRLLFRLRRERLLDEAPSRRGYYALAASIAIVGLATLLIPRQDASPPPESQVWRGSEAPQRIVSPNPKAAADRIEAILTERQLLVRRTVEGNAIRLQAQIEAADRAAFQAALHGEHVSIPPHGRLDVLIVR